MPSIFRHRFRRPTIIAVVCTAVLIGIALAYVPHTDWLRYLLLAAPIGLWRARRQDVWALLAFLCIAMSTGSIRGGQYMHYAAVYPTLYKQKVVLLGQAQSDAVYGIREQLVFTMGALHLSEPYQKNLVGVIGVSGFGASAIYRGDTVQVSGELYPTLGGNQATISFAKLQVVAHHASWLDTVREKFVAGEQSALPEPEASFGLGLLIGQRSTLPTVVAQQLTMVGLAHIIAVSGYNVTIIVQVARRLLGKRSKFQATVTCVGLIFMFVLFTGSSPSIVRAMIVSLLSIAAWYYGRTVRPVVLLLLPAAVTAFVNPLYVWGNVSWYLSFLAFAGVLLVAPLVQARFLGNHSPGTLQAILVESVCAELLTAPYVLLIFGQMSLVALPANVLVVALVPLAMLLSLAAGIAGMCAPSLAGWIALPAKYLLTYMLDAAHLLSRIPHAFVQHIAFYWWEMIAAYGMVAGLGLLWWRGTHKSAIITDEIAEETEGA